jgi:RES domain
MLVIPPRGLASIALRMVQVQPSKLYRVSTHSSGEPYFGRNGSNRFDDPTRAKGKRFGTCYLGEGLEVAIAETVLHDEMPVGGRFNLAADELERRNCVRFSAGSTLNLVDLTGTALKSLVGSSEISTVLTYDLPQRWALALHRHPAGADGLLYMSRHVNNQRAVVVFDRAAHKLGLAAYRPLARTNGALSAVMDLRINFKFA